MYITEVALSNNRQTRNKNNKLAFGNPATKTMLTTTLSDINYYDIAQAAKNEKNFEKIHAANNKILNYLRGRYIEFAGNIKAVELFPAVKNEESYSKKLVLQNGSETIKINHKATYEHSKQIDEILEYTELTKTTDGQRKINYIKYFFTKDDGLFVKDGSDTFTISKLSNV